MNKKLYLRDGYVGGVCAGLGDWSGIQSIIWRIGFLFIPHALIVYIILWIFVKRKND